MVHLELGLFKNLSENNLNSSTNWLDESAMHQFDKFLSINVASDFSLIYSLFFPNKWLNVSRWNICRIVHRELGLFMAVWIYSSDSALRSILLVMSFLQYVNTLLFIYPWPLTTFFFWNMSFRVYLGMWQPHYLAN